MPGSSGNSSFIPKRGTSNHKRKIHKGKIYSLTIISYVLLFAALAASAAVYVYSGVVRGQLEAEAKAMNEAISVFKEADMKRVQEFDKRLQQANQRLNNSASVSSILTAMEAAVIDTVRFDQFTLMRNMDDEFILQIDAETDTFDSSIFQRELYGDDETVDEVEISSLTLSDQVDENNVSLGQSIIFEAKLSVPLSAVPYQADPLGPSQEDVPAPEPSEPAEEQPETNGEAGSDAAEEIPDNQDDI